MDDRETARRTKRRATWRAGLIILAFFAVTLAAHAFWIEPSSLRVAHYEVRLQPAAGTAGHLRVAVIADLHAGAPFIDADKIERVVAWTNREKPDLILLLGDYVVQGVIGGHPMPIDDIAPHLRRLTAPLGVFAVLGNHDRFHGGGPHVRDVLEANGIRVLDDQSVVLTRGPRTLYLAGISDMASGDPDVAKALANVPVGEGALCFTHSPDVFPLLPPKCVLTFAGHTHGGQVRFPLVGRMIVPSRYGQRYAIGLITEGDKMMFVASGIGTSILPVRFLVPPEVSVVDID